MLTTNPHNCQGAHKKIKKKKKKRLQIPTGVATRTCLCPGAALARKSHSQPYEHFGALGRSAHRLGVLETSQGSRKGRVLKCGRGHEGNR